MLVVVYELDPYRLYISDFQIVSTFIVQSFPDIKHYSHMTISHSILPFRFVNNKDSSSESTVGFSHVSVNAKISKSNSSVCKISSLETILLTL